MDKILAGVKEIFDKVHEFTFTTCGGCGGELALKERLRDPTLMQVFIVQPLPDVTDREAAFATLQGARLLHEGKLDESLRQLHEARRRAPQCVNALCNLGCAYYERGDEDAALHWYREAHSLQPRDATATLAMAHLEMCTGHPSDASWLLTNFLQEVDSNNVNALRLLARSYEEQGNWAKAATYYKQIIRLEPQNSRWPDLLRRCADKSSTVIVVDPPPEQVIRGSNEHVIPSSVYARVAGGEGGKREGRDEQGPYSRNVPAKEIEEATKLRNSGHPVAALSAFKGLIKTKARNEALAGIVDCECDLGNFDGAMEAIKQLLSSNEDDPAVNLRMAEVLLAAGQPNFVVEPYAKKALAARKNPSLKHRLLCLTAEIALAKEDYRQALSSASEAVRLDASVPRGLLLLGSAKLEVAEYSAAQRMLTAALDAACAGPSTYEAKRLRAVAHTLAARAHERQRQFPQAIDQAQKALDINPQLDDAHVIRATALMQSGRSREALVELEAVVQRNPQHVAALIQLGYLQLCSGDAKSVQTLEVAAFGSYANGSALGAAKVYLALALDMHPELCARGRPEQVLRDGLGSHKNLQVVWEDIDQQGLGLRQPVAAMQKLRGICDLDLTSAQARQLLGLLANAQGRPELARAVASTAGPEQLGSRAGSRSSSLQPQRWAPSGVGLDSSGSRGGSMTGSAVHTPGAHTPIGGHGSFGRLGDRGHLPAPQVGSGGYGVVGQTIPAVARQRSSSPVHYRFGQGRIGTPDGSSVVTPGGRPFRQGRSASMERLQQPYLVR